MDWNQFLKLWTIKSQCSCPWSLPIKFHAEPSKAKSYKTLAGRTEMEIETERREWGESNKLARWTSVFRWTSFGGHLSLTLSSKYLTTLCWSFFWDFSLIYFFNFFLLRCLTPRLRLTYGTAPSSRYSSGCGPWNRPSMLSSLHFWRHSDGPK